MLYGCKPFMATRLSSAPITRGGAVDSGAIESESNSQHDKLWKIKYEELLVKIHFKITKSRFIEQNLYPQATCRMATGTD